MKKLNVVAIRMLSLFFILSIIYSIPEFFSMMQIEMGFKPLTAILYSQITKILLAVILWVLATKLADRILKSVKSPDHRILCRLVLVLIGLYFSIDGVSGLVSYFGYPPVHIETFISQYWFVERLVKIALGLNLILGADILVKAVFSGRDGNTNSPKTVQLFRKNNSFQKFVVVFIRIMVLFIVLFIFQQTFLPIVFDVLFYRGMASGSSSIQIALLAGTGLVIILFLLWMLADKLAGLVVSFKDEKFTSPKIELDYIHLFKIALAAAGVLIFLSGLLNIFEMMTRPVYRGIFNTELFFPGVVQIALALFLIIRGQKVINVIDS